MQKKDIKKYCCFLVFIWVLFTFSIKINAQTPYNLLDNNHHSIYLQPCLSNLRHADGVEYLKSRYSLDLSIGYDKLYSIRGFSGVGVGASIGYINYKIEPENYSENLYSTSNRVIRLNFPIYINKYYPFNKRLSMYVKGGLNISTIFTSLVDFGSIKKNGDYIFRTSVEFKTFPQPGILFELGSTYSLKNNNFLSFGIVINKNFINVIHVNYEYYIDGIDEPFTGNFESAGSSFGFSLRYNFKTFLNEYY